MIATYEPIASQFQRLAEGPLLLTAYTLGYCVALPVVSRYLSRSSRTCAVADLSVLESVAHQLLLSRDPNGARVFLTTQDSMDG